jgi:DNA replication protein DnaC
MRPQIFAPILAEIIPKNFKVKHKHKNKMYRLDEIVKEMRERGMNVPELPTRIKIENGTSIMMQYFQYFINQRGETFSDRPEYKEVGAWLEDNQSKGLFLYGSCGTGKSQLARLVIPSILLNYCRLIVSVFDATALNKKPDEIISKHIICLDDVGCESKDTVLYGQHRLPLAELLDACEKRGKLFIGTSNLNVHELLDRYGERTLDRIKSMTKRILFTGDSFRK